MVNSRWLSLLPAGPEGGQTAKHSAPKLDAVPTNSVAVAELAGPITHKLTKLTNKLS